ncbi:DUF805 domain-containing protein [Notoacmeibacter ruber]|nr:DUF805 domain-containing protein [Notoacmeibacter ruber]
MRSYLNAIRKYATFSGRASRTEYWLFALFYFIFGAVAVFLDALLFDAVGEDPGPLTILFVIAHILPGFAVLSRRLHDTDHSAWWMLLYLTGIGIFILLIFALIRGTEGPNRYGVDPHGEGSVMPAAAHGHPQGGGGADIVAELERLSSLKERGAISEDEYAAMKARALGTGNPA